VITNYLGGIQYADFLEITFPFLLKDVPYNVHEGMWFQHDSAPPTSHTKGITTILWTHGLAIRVQLSGLHSLLDFFLWGDSQKM
jgi:hypothetical protein